ncbi:carbon starvation protein A [candidate division TA06 bacterium]|uniref:Carbon starvation protein A n=1 Tax=candidate division TA06 bacterium TaxID=2250710 RepID=A0A660SP40_UNCT6|nr:MAG: carbon starvation protein A [candidate division TA06 bacterium]
MDVVLLMIVIFLAFFIVYKLYGTFIAKKIYKLRDENITPSKEFEDGIDYVPTKKEIIFGHHFTSIAGTGPIVGPAIAIIWGWVPALIWIVVGTLVMGAVHDFGSLVLSMRNQGKSISEITGKYISRRARTAFFGIVFIELLIVIAIFGLVMAVVFHMYPQSVFPVWFEIPLAIWMGYMVYKKKGNLFLYSIFAIVIMYITIGIGTMWAINMPAIGGIPATGVWTIILLIYAYIASILPVTTLLQPRDYINSHELFVAMGLLVLGVIASAFKGGFHIVAPAVNASPAGAPPVIPFLFITIACGAISGFHSLVSSGTSSKQVMKESDTQLVGYGSMVMEGVLASMVVIAVSAGIGLAYKTSGGTVVSGVQAWTAHYSSWAAAAGLGSKVAAFVIGSANMIHSLGIPQNFAIVIMGVFVVSFAGTTLDTATRIQRYIVSELFGKAPVFRNRYFATAIAVVTAGLLAFATGASGKGALKLWPLFGATNQTLAALALLLITVWLKQKGGMRYLIAGLPCIFMAIMTTWALIINQSNFISAHNPLLIIINIIILALNLWIIVEGLMAFAKGKKKVEVATE